MGETSRKFTAWARYEFGTAIGGLSGNCNACGDAHKLLRKQTPCLSCPKYNLYPQSGNQGLHEKNTLAVQLYYMASRDIRVGMDGILIGTMTTEAAYDAIDLYSEHMPTPLAKQQCFELMNILDQVATKTRGERESIEREQALDSARAK